MSDTPRQDRQTSQAPTESATPEETPAETTPPPEPTPEEPDTFDIDEGDYVGRDVKDVEGELKDLGLKPKKEEVDNDGTHEEDTVASVSPTSGLQEGDEVAVRYYAEPAEVPEPPETPPGQEKKEDEDE